MISHDFGFVIASGAGTIFQQGGQAWCVWPNLFQLGCGGAVYKPPGGVRGRAPEANAFWKQSFEN